MSKLLSVIALLTTVIMSGCATTSDSELKPIDYSHMKFLGHAGQAPELTKEFNSTYEAVWKATLEKIQEIGHPIQTISKESGTLTTDYLERGGGPFLLGLPSDTFKDRFIIRVFKVGDSRTKIGIRRSVQKIQGIKTIPKTSDGKIEKWLLEEIALKLSATKLQPKKELKSDHSKQFIDKGVQSDSHKTPNHVKMYYLHVSSLRHKLNAEKEAKRLEKYGYKSFLGTKEVSGKQWFRVYIGTFHDKKEAQKVGSELKKKRIISYFRPTKHDQIKFVRRSQ